MELGYSAVSYLTLISGRSFPLRSKHQPLWPTVNEAAPLIGTTTDAIYRDIRNGVFPFRWLEIGGLIRISARDIGLIADSGESQKREAEQQGETLPEAA